MERASHIGQWLIEEARLMGDGRLIIEGYCNRLRAAGVPLWRARIAQRLANPLLSAWGVIWTTESAQEYEVPTQLLSTTAWIGSPFEFVTRERKPLHKPLVRLGEQDHATYRDLAAQGATDFFALPLIFGDGTAQGASFATCDAKGFSPSQIDLVTATSAPLAAALEPTAMRRSLQSLLNTYLGTRAGAQVYGGSIHLGEAHEIKAALAMFDLRAFTEKAMSWPTQTLLEHLGAYFKLVADAVEAHGGDVLKFIGDGVLAVFPVDARMDAVAACDAAIRAASEALRQTQLENVERNARGQAAIRFGVGMDFGSVTFGNIGSPSRLDFTVLGTPVNTASRLQDLCKSLGVPLLMAPAVAAETTHRLYPMGSHEIRGLDGPLDLHTLGEWIEC